MRVSSLQAVLMTGGLENLVSFYMKVFDATEAVRVPPAGEPHYIGIQVGDGVLGFVRDAHGAGADNQRILLSIEVSDPDALLVDVEAAGGRILGKPNDMPWGQRVAHVQDPDGNLVNLTKNL